VIIFVDANVLRADPSRSDPIWAVLRYSIARGRLSVRVPEIALMEDIETSRRLKGISPPRCLRARVTTSGRRWENRGVLRTILLMWRLPARVAGAPVDLKTWVALGRDPLVALLLLVTFLQMSGQFVVFTFMAPLLQRLAGAGPEAIAIVFSLYGIFGFVGNVIATRLVDSWGGYRTSLIFTATLLIGVSIWALGVGLLGVMAFGVSVWGLGFASTNSMQQVRLVGAAPPFAGASVSLNTSVLYVGQAVGSAIGGMLYVRDQLHATGYAAAAFVAVALAVVLVTGRLPKTKS